MASSYILVAQQLECQGTVQITKCLSISAGDHRSRLLHADAGSHQAELRRCQ